MTAQRTFAALWDRPGRATSDLRGLGIAGVFDDASAAGMGSVADVWRVLPEVAATDIEQLRPDAVLLSPFADGRQRRWREHLALDRGPMRKVVDRAAELGIPAFGWDADGTWSAPLEGRCRRLSLTGADGTHRFEFAADPAEHGPQRASAQTPSNDDQRTMAHGVFVDAGSARGRVGGRSRGLIEAAAGRRALVSTPGDALEDAFDAHELVGVATAGEAAMEAARLTQDDGARAVLAQRAWRRVSREHLWIHRRQALEALLGMESVPARSTLTVLVTHDDDPREVVRAIARQRTDGLLREPLRVHLRPRDGGAITDDALARVRAEIGVDVRAHAREPLRTDLVAGVDARHEYGRNYLADLLLLLERFPVGDVVTKPSWRDRTLSDQYVDRAWAGAWIARGSAAQALIGGDVRAPELATRAFAADALSHTPAAEPFPVDLDA